jgi:hypothetical protein
MGCISREVYGVEFSKGMMKDLQAVTTGLSTTAMDQRANGIIVDKDTLKAVVRVEQ